MACSSRLLAIISALMLALPGIGGVESLPDEEALQYLVRKNNLAEVKEWLKKHGTEKASYEQLVDSFFLALDKGHFEIIEAMLTSRPGLANEHHSAGTAITAAAANKDNRILPTVLARGGDPLWQDGDGYSPIVYAALMGNLDGVKLLIKKGAKVTHRTKDGSTLLIQISQMPDVSVARLQVASFLIAEKVDVNAQNQNGETALFWARKLKNETLALILQRAGATR